MPRFNISDYVASKGLRRTKLKDSELKACCPFHADGSPSFSINIETGAWLCRASNTCGLRGGIVAFISRMEGISFRDAAKIAQIRAPLENQKELDSLFNPPQREKKTYANPVLPLCTKVTDQYPDYLAVSRRFAPESGVGQAWDLRYASGNDSVYRTRFHDYLIMPVYDYEGKYVSFTARYAGARKNALRYDGPDFPLKDYLYGEWLLRDDDSPIFLLEGQFDTMRLWSFGESALGTFGTTYTDKQVKRLLQIAGRRRLVACYDDDTIRRDDVVGDDVAHSTPMKLVSSLRAFGAEIDFMDVAQFGVHDADGFDEAVWRDARATLKLSA